MKEMDTTFMVIMALIHFNPINLILKYIIIKFEDFTMVMSTVKRELNEKTLIPRVERTTVLTDELPEQDRYS